MIALPLRRKMAEECWESGWAIDLSANGMRLRTPVCLPLKQRVRLQFALPIGLDNLAFTMPYLQRFQ